MHRCKKLSPMNDLTSNIMSRDIFEAIKSNLHIVYNTLQDAANANLFFLS